VAGAGNEAAKTPMGTVALIALGSNLGGRRAHLDAAVERLAASPGIAVRAVSTYHETAPVGGPAGQGAFLNAAAAIETELPAAALLERLHAIEAAEGRVRADRWGARSLDLDLLLYGGAIIRPSPGAGAAHSRPIPLQVPHPWLPFRRFVLAPLAEIAPDAVDPITGATVAGLLANLDRRPSYVAIHDPADRFARALLPEIVPALGAAVLHERDLEAPPDPAAAPSGAGHAQGGASPERWLVSPFWIGGRTNTAGGAGGGGVAGAHDVGPVPTFVVAEPPAAASHHGLPPILSVDPAEPSGLAARVLAACRASRPD
jgi:2-amino-4-hydroxy-6-hydroxymethyldihydropteridine diphosphokinase